MTVSSTLRRAARTLAAPSAAALLVTALAAPAAAAPPDRSTSSSTRTGTSAFVSWTELDPGEVLGLPGNTHVGFLHVEDAAWGTFAFGEIRDFDCDPGEVPSDGHGGEGGEGTCDAAGTRFLSAEDVDLTVDARAGTAMLSGTITVSNGGHGEPGQVLALVPASITWTATGGLSRFRETYTYSEGGVRFSSRIQGLSSDPDTTTVTGKLGRMGFADDADDSSSGGFRTFTETSRDRIR